MLLCFVGNEGGFDELSTTESPTLSKTIKYNMRKSLDLEQEGCYLEVGKKECLEECGFNVTAKTIFIIHGWTVIYSSAIYPLSYLFFLLAKMQLANSIPGVKSRTDVAT